MNLFNYTLRFNGFPIGKAKEELAYIMALDTDELASHIEQKKWGVVNYHLEHNSFYKALLKGSNLNSWGDVPVITKQDLQQPLERRLSDNFNKNNVYVNKTSGSSGHPFVFAKDKFAHAMTWAIFDEWYNWHRVYGTKQARFYGIPKNGPKYYKERLKDLFSNRFRFDVFDLSERSMKKWTYTFSKKSFVFITGYTSVIVAFAQYLISEKIILKDICPTLRVCFPTSEICSDADKKLIELALGIPVKKEYGAAEFGLIALEKGSEWILNTLNLYVEIVDDHNNVLPYGEEGRILVTDLYNKAHPFIRYEIGDIGKINNEDGVLVLERIIGRKEDYVLLPSGKKAPGLAFYYVTKSVMQDDGTVKEIKVIQTALNAIEIHYVAASELSQGQRDTISNALDDYLEPGINITYIKKSNLERTSRGKLKQFTSLLKK